MLDLIRNAIIDVINSTYSFFMGVKNSLGFLDTPGTYILWMVIGIIFIPFFARSVYGQYANPHGYYGGSLKWKIIKGAVFITAWLVFGYANFMRFIEMF